MPPAGSTITSGISGWVGLADRYPIRLELSRTCPPVQVPMACIVLGGGVCALIAEISPALPGAPRSRVVLAVLLHVARTTSIDSLTLRFAGMALKHHVQGLRPTPCRRRHGHPAPVGCTRRLRLHFFPLRLRGVALYSCNALATSQGAAPAGQVPQQCNTCVVLARVLLNRGMHSLMR